MLPAILFLLILFVLALTRGVYISKKNKVKKALAAVREALWLRHAKMPLLISLCHAKSEEKDSIFAQLLAIREELSAEHMPWSERMNGEKRITHLLNEMLVLGASHSSQSKDPLFIAQSRNLADVASAIGSAIQGYNTELQAFIQSTRMPWVKLWSNVLQKHTFEPLTGV